MKKEEEMQDGVILNPLTEFMGGQMEAPASSRLIHNIAELNRINSNQDGEEAMDIIDQLQDKELSWIFRPSMIGLTAQDMFDETIDRIRQQADIPAESDRQINEGQDTNEGFLDQLATSQYA